jgi:hypothetical protein
MLEGYGCHKVLTNTTKGLPYLLVNFRRKGLVNFYTKGLFDSHEKKITGIAYA